MAASINEAQCRAMVGERAAPCCAVRWLARVRMPVAFATGIGAMEGADKPYLFAIWQPRRREPAWSTV
jgi:hypothetical protein